MSTPADQLWAQLTGQDILPHSSIPDISLPGMDVSSGLQDLSTTPWGDLGAFGKMGVVSSGLGAAVDLAKLWTAIQGIKLQKDQFAFQKDAWWKNYNNQVKDYENTLKDKWAANRASAGARGATYESLNSWMSGRQLTGRAPTPVGFGETDPAAYQRTGG